jgi:hypothetical protein
MRRYSEAIKADVRRRMSPPNVPSWLKRMHDRQLAMPLCPGLVDPGWIESQSLVLHPKQPHLIEQLRLLLPQGLVGSSREARHLIRTLRQRVETAGEKRLGEGEEPEVNSHELLITSTVAQFNPCQTAAKGCCNQPRTAEFQSALRHAVAPPGS